MVEPVADVVFEEADDRAVRVELVEGARGLLVLSTETDEVVQAAVVVCRSNQSELRIQDGNRHAHSGIDQ